MKRIRQWLALLILFLFLPAVPGVLAVSLSHIECVNFKYNQLNDRYLVHSVVIINL